MPITKERSTAKATVTFMVDGPESDTPLMLGAVYAYRGQKIFPSVVEVVWERIDGEPWTLYGVRVYGDVQTKGGARGKAYTERWAWEGYGLDQSWTDDTPDWLKSAVMNNQPQ